MLQIASGRFFGQEFITTERSAILYSNFSWPQRIDLGYLSLSPVHGSSWPVAYIVRYDQHHYAKNGQHPKILLPSTTVVHQIAALASLVLGAVFDPDRYAIEYCCRDHPRFAQDALLPVKLLPPNFRNIISGTTEDIILLQQHLSKLLTLERSRFEAIFSAILAVDGATRVLSHSIDLAYSLLVYALESLAQGFDNFSPSWEDVPQSLRGQFDDILANCEEAVRSEVKSVLVNGQFLRLQERFVEFTAKHVKDGYFVDEAKTVKNAVRPSELRSAIRKAYSLRSGFAHELKPITKHLRIDWIAEYDTFSWENSTHLTFQGLYRLVRHVLLNFTSDSLSIDPTDEKFDWRDSEEGTIKLHVSSEYWLHQVDTAKEINANHLFSAVLSNIEESVSQGKGLVKLISLLLAIESEINQIPVKQRPALKALYLIYQGLIRPELRTAKYDRFCALWELDTKICSIENMLLHLFAPTEFIWSGTDCLVEYDNFIKSSTKNLLKVPRILNTCILGKIASRFATEGDEDNKQMALHRAIMESAGMTEIQLQWNSLQNSGFQKSFELSDIFPNLKAPADPMESWTPEI